MFCKDNLKIHFLWSQNSKRAKKVTSHFSKQNTLNILSNRSHVYNIIFILYKVDFIHRQLMITFLLLLGTLIVLKNVRNLEKNYLKPLIFPLSLCLSVCLDSNIQVTL